MAEIYSLSGDPIPEERVTPGEAHPLVVEALEKLLERARSGDMRGFACIYLYGDMATGGVLAGTRSFSLIGRMEDIKMEILDELAEG